MEHHLRNSNLVGYRIAANGVAYRCGPILEAFNEIDLGEFHCHRPMHPGGRALPVIGCPHGHFPRRSTLSLLNPKTLLQFQSTAALSMPLAIIRCPRLQTISGARANIFI
jgi:hypothetical protein